MIKRSFRMQKSFSEVAISTLEEAGGGETTLYDQINEVSREFDLFLVSDSLKVGVENYIVIDSSKEAFPALVKGYRVTTSFSGYEAETGYVDTTIEAIYLDKDGKEYNEADCLAVSKTYEEAEKKRKELLNN